jgi:hypothetical protein
MGLQHGDDMLIAESATGFAAEVVRAYCDEDLWSRLAIRGRLTIAKEYSPDAVRPLLAQVLSALGVASHGGGFPG